MVGNVELTKSSRTETMKNLDLLLPPNPIFQTAQTETLPEHRRLLFSRKSDIRHGTVVCEMSAASVASLDLNVVCDCCIQVDEPKVSSSGLEPDER